MMVSVCCVVVLLCILICCRFLLMVFRFSIWVILFFC